MKKALLFFTIIIISLNIYTLELMILHTNDHHGRLFNYWHELNEVAGLAARAEIIKQQTENNENYLLLDAGDFNTGVYESLLYNAEPDIQAYNIIGYNAVTLGNHEFYGDLARVKQQIEWAKFPMLSANIFDQENQLVAEPYTIFTMANGVKVAVLGLTTTHKTLASDFVIRDDVEAAQYFVPLLREEADVVIVLAHLGIYDLGEEELYGSIRLATHVPGIDLIVDGDTHTLLEEPLYVNGIPIVQAGDRGRYLGKAILNIDETTRAVSLTSWETVAMMREYNDPPFEINENVFDVIEVFRQRAISDGNVLLGKTERPFRRYNMNNRITALGRVVCESFKLAAISYDAEVAITVSGAIRGDILPGEIRYSDVYNILPFRNHLVVLELPGTVLLEIITVSFLEKIDTSAFLQYSNNVGIIQRPPNIVTPNLTGDEIQPDRIYKVVTTSFLADGGGGYTQFEYAINRIDLEITEDAAMADYIKNTEHFQ